MCYNDSAFLFEGKHMAKKKGAGGKPQEFNENNGQYSSFDFSEYQYPQYLIRMSTHEGRKKESGAISGAQSGALDADGKDGERAQRHAEMMYETFRNITSDVFKISTITGHTQGEIQRVKNHIFFNEYELADGKHRFASDFDQAQSWDRLRNGEPLEHDLIMIEHELIEERLMREQGLSYDEAHEKANETANYQRALQEYKNGKNKKKRN